jgi:hypothetical protein
MTKQTTLTGVCVTGICLLQLYSCIKPSHDFDPHDFDPRDGKNVYNGCRVKQINNLPGIEGDSLTWQFVYNSNNDPVSVSNNSVGTGKPNLIFKYDRKYRLIEYSGIYTNGQYEFVHRYGYSQNRIVTDTQYVFGTYGNLTDYYGKRYKYLSYDNLNRIVKDSEVFVFPGPMLNIINYSYNANGNLINGKTYDNKLNPHRTNKVWMFIDRDYSVNNPAVATTYNSVGLPLTYNPGAFIYAFTFAYIFYYGSTQIIYDCK